MAASSQIYSSRFRYELTMARVRLGKLRACALRTGEQPNFPDRPPIDAPIITENTAEIATKKFLFVVGLHRSGTTALARALAAHGEVSALSMTSVKKDEGQFLQTVFLPDSSLGGPGRFGFHPKSHVTEPCSQDEIIRTRDQLLHQWSHYWDTTSSVLLEKSPSNLLRTRLLASCFPNAIFVFIRRHPVPVCLATQRWTGQSLYSLFRHYFHCHEIWKADRRRIRQRIVEVSYENLCDQPRQVLSEICRAALIDDRECIGTNLESSHNEPYLRLWRKLYVMPHFIRQAFERSANEYGYSLAHPYYISEGS